MVSIELEILEREMKSHLYPSTRVGEVVSPEAARQVRREWRVQQDEILGRWKAQCLKDYGLTYHPKATAVMDMAWDEGHSAGLHEVDSWVCKLAELVLSG